MRLSYSSRLVAFALHQRSSTLALALPLTAGGIVSFHRLPIEAYPDVADVEVARSSRSGRVTLGRRGRALHHDPARERDQRGSQT